MERSFLHRTAYALGIAARSAVAAVGIPVRAAVRLLTRWRYPDSQREHLQLPAHRPPRARRPDPGSSELSRTLDHPDPEVRCRAVPAVLDLEPEQREPLLLQLLYDVDAGVRQAAADAAGEVRASATAFSLILALDDPADEVRQAASRALRRITGQAVSPLADPAARRKQIEELKEQWKEQRLADLAGSLKRAT